MAMQNEGAKIVAFIPALTLRRYEICRKCGFDWNVSRQAKISQSGYLCPECRNKCRKVVQKSDNIHSNIDCEASL